MTSINTRWPADVALGGFQASVATCGSWRSAGGPADFSLPGMHSSRAGMVVGEEDMRRSSAQRGADQIEFRERLAFRNECPLSPPHSNLVAVPNGVPTKPMVRPWHDRPVEVQQRPVSRLSYARLPIAGNKKPPIGWSAGRESSLRSGSLEQPKLLR